MWKRTLLVMVLGIGLTPGLGLADEVKVVRSTSGVVTAVRVSSGLVEMGERKFQVGTGPIVQGESSLHVLSADLVGKPAIIEFDKDGKVVRVVLAGPH